MRQTAERDRHGGIFGRGKSGVEALVDIFHIFEALGSTVAMSKVLAMLQHNIVSNLPTSLDSHDSRHSREQSSCKNYFSK